MLRSGGIASSARVLHRLSAPARSPHLARHYASKSSSSSTTSTALLSLGFILAAAGTYYYETRAATFSGYPSTVSYTVRGRTHTFPRKTDEEIETMLTEHEDGQRVNRPGNPVIRWDRNWVGCNEPCEDRSAVDIVPRSSGVSDAQGITGIRREGDRDIGLFSIIDGHAGDATSQLLSKALHPTITLALAGLQAGATKPSAKLWNPLSWFEKGQSWTPTSVSETIEQAFVNLDDNICQTPVNLLNTVTGPSDPNAPSPTPGQTFVALAAPAQAGAVAVSTVIDAENDDLYVALTGDCRAVAGWQDASGKWRCDILSEDQMGENPKEVARVRAEHPASERDTVVMRGRMQGGLQPTRAFGDAVYKWTREEATRINQIFHWEGKEGRNQRSHHYTPPYVTARPVIVHRKLQPESGEKLKFIVMATDGLWDRISSEESTLLVASYMQHHTNEDIPKTILPQRFPLLPPTGERPYPAEDLPGTKDRAAGSWVFEGDKNAATHLIRNSMGGGDRKQRGELLSMHGDIARWARDDITVNVLFFDESVSGQKL